MKITYDETKRVSNIEKHGLDFADLTIDFFATSIVVPSKAERFMAIGEFQGRMIVAVVFRPLGGASAFRDFHAPGQYQGRRL